MRLISATPYFYDQNPVSEGDRDLVLFGGQAKPREASISVVEVRGKQVVLDLLEVGVANAASLDPDQ